MRILYSLLSSTLRKAESQGALGHENRISFFNHHTIPHVICVEPWGEDYTLAANERFELVAYSSRLEPSFELTNDGKDATQVWCDEAETFEVTQAGNVLKCGHNRGLASSDA